MILRLPFTSSPEEAKRLWEEFGFMPRHAPTAKAFDRSSNFSTDKNADNVDFNMIHAPRCTLCCSKRVAQSMVHYRRHAFMKMRPCIRMTRVAKLNVVTVCSAATSEGQPFGGRVWILLRQLFHLWDEVHDTERFRHNIVLERRR